MTTVEFGGLQITFDSRLLSPPAMDAGTVPVGSLAVAEPAPWRRSGTV